MKQVEYEDIHEVFAYKKDLNKSSLIPQVINSMKLS